MDDRGTSSGVCHNAEMPSQSDAEGTARQGALYLCGLIISVESLLQMHCLWTFRYIFMRHLPLIQGRPVCCRTCQILAECKCLSRSAALDLGIKLVVAVLEGENAKQNVNIWSLSLGHDHLNPFDGNKNIQRHQYADLMLLCSALPYRSCLRGAAMLV